MDRRLMPLSIALVVCTVIAATAWAGVKLSRPTTIDVRGSAKKRINSDLAEWTASLTSVKPTRVEAYGALTRDLEQVRGFLKAAGLPDTAMRASAVDLLELTHEDVVEEGARRGTRPCSTVGGRNRTSRSLRLT